jgi:hypothetical protein
MSNVLYLYDLRFDSAPNYPRAPTSILCLLWLCSQSVCGGQAADGEEEDDLIADGFKLNFGDIPLETPLPLASVPEHKPHRIALPEVAREAQAFILMLRFELAKAESFHQLLFANLQAHYTSFTETIAHRSSTQHVSDADLAEYLRDLQNWGDFCLLNSTAALKILKKRTLV